MAGADETAVVGAAGGGGLEGAGGEAEGGRLRIGDFGLWIDGWHCKCTSRNAFSIAYGSFFASSFTTFRTRLKTAGMSL